MKQKKLLLLLFLVYIFLGPVLLTGLEYSHDKELACVQGQKTPLQLLASYFKSKGFISGKVHIHELSLDVSLNSNQFFRLEVDVEDVYSRINELRQIFELPGPYRDIARGRGWCGIVSAEHKTEKAYGYVVLIKKGLNPESEIYTLGHEYGHFIWYTEHQDWIYHNFKKPERVRALIQHNHDFAMLCGWIAFQNAGFDLDESAVIIGQSPEDKRKSERMRNLISEDYIRPVHEFESTGCVDFYPYNLLY